MTGEWGVIWSLDPLNMFSAELPAVGLDVRKTLRCCDYK